MASTKIPRTTIETQDAQKDEARPEASAAAGTAPAGKHAAQPGAAKADAAAAAQEQAPDGQGADGAQSSGSLKHARRSLAAWLAENFPGHENAVFGGLIGLVIAILVFVIGFWQTLFITACVLVGVAVGQYADGNPKVVNAFLSLFGNRD